MEKIIQVRDFRNLIFEFRGIKVMIDSDLAVLYETETKKLKQQVKRNSARFPTDFMFELSIEEKQQLMAQAPRLNNLKYSSINPLAFTEQGVSMLSSVLTTPKAILMNVEIMRAFAQYRAILLENIELRKEIKDMDKKLTAAFKFLLNKIDALSPRISERNLLALKVKIQKVAANLWPVLSKQSYVINNFQITIFKINN